MKSFTTRWNDKIVFAFLCILEIEEVDKQMEKVKKYKEREQI